jgi:hypothetical protein
MLVQRERAEHFRGDASFRWDFSTLIARLVARCAAGARVSASSY